ncbi:O-antigen ligase family protein, partial [bacterium]|nr:O-antigen ligase family protein [bacterium]
MSNQGANRWMIGVLGVLAFLAPLKFGTPVVLQDQVFLPSGGWQWLFFSWPNQLLVLGVFLGLGWWVLDGRRPAARVDLLLVLPLLLLAAQLPSLTGSINPRVSAATVMHLASCVVVFYVAAWYVRDGAAAGWLFGGIGLAVCLVVVFALQQACGGLEATRQYAAQHVDLAAAPPDLRLRLTSNRVFSTLVGPNSLAGFLVIAFAPALVWVGWRGRGWDRRIRRLVLVFISSLMLVCLLLSGSRGGFLAFGAAVLVGGWAAFGPRSGQARWVWPMVALALAVVFVGGHWLGVFHVRSTSIEARLDYWRGAVAIIRDHPWTGTGPGTFGSIYPMYKTALTEQAQLAHNSYLQMWSDTGLAAFLVGLGLWGVALKEAWRLARDRRGDPAALAILTALVGWVVHCLVDDDFYVPALALTAFMLMGALQGLKQPAWQDPTRQILPPGPLRRVAVILTVLLAAGVIWIEGRDLVAANAQGRSVRRMEHSCGFRAKVSRQ